MLYGNQMTTEEMWSRLTPREQEEVFSPLNLYYCGLKLKHAPSPDEAIKHYYDHTNFGVHFPVNIDRVNTASELEMLAVHPYPA